jgi:hypothetical protein
MKSLLEILTNIRIATGEIAGTLGFIFLVGFGLYKAWREFVVKALK